MNQVVEVVIHAVLPKPVLKTFGKLSYRGMGFLERVLVFTAVLLTFPRLNQTVTRGEDTLRLSCLCPPLPESERPVGSELGGLLGNCTMTRNSVGAWGRHAGHGRAERWGVERHSPMFN